MASSGAEGYPLVWWWRSKLPKRKGEPCRVVVRGSLSTVLVEFPDGLRVATSRHAVRRPPGAPTPG